MRLKRKKVTFEDLRVWTQGLTIILKAPPLVVPAWDRAFSIIKAKLGYELKLFETTAPAMVRASSSQLNVTQTNSSQLKIKTGNDKSPTPARFLCLTSRTQIELKGTQIPPKYSAR